MGRQVTSVWLWDNCKDFVSFFGNNCKFQLHSQRSYILAIKCNKAALVLAKMTSRRELASFMHGVSFRFTTKPLEKFSASRSYKFLYVCLYQIRFKLFQFHSYFLSALPITLVHNKWTGMKHRHCGTLSTVSSIFDIGDVSEVGFTSAFRWQLFIILTILVLLVTTVRFKSGTF
jgi:hypothetical protein